MNACMQVLVQMGGCEMEVHGISVAYHKQLKMELVSYPLPSAYHMEIQRCRLFVEDDAFALKPHTKLVRETFKEYFCNEGAVAWQWQAC